MENAEVDVALEELENRLERLRALYEQYFMGIERIEPAIPRKDIDRRIYVLRREKIRNTAKRFKLQTIISRYNTFQQYWQRICREIEQGTYKRHVIKAERIAPGKLLTIAARKRLGRAALDAMEVDAAPAESRAGDATRASSAPPAAASSFPPQAAPASSIPPKAAAASAGPAAARLAPPPKPVPPPKPGARASGPTPPAPSAPAVPPAPRAQFESLDLDMDFMGDWDPAAAAKTAGAPRKPDAGTRPFGKPLSRPLAAPPAASATAPEKPALGSAARGAVRAPPARPATNAPAIRASSRPPAVPPGPAPAPAPVPTVARPALPRPALPRPAQSSATPAAAPPLARPTPPPAAAKPLAAPFPGTQPARPAPAAAAAVPTSVNDARVRDLHARLIEAKRQTQDSAQVSLEGLAKSMKATEAKLREQHKNRKIDFDVVIKDGKAVLKPIVR